MKQNQNKWKNNLLIKMKKYALEKNIPIIHDETLFFLQKIIQKNNISHILEIGTAIGYSSLAMSNKFNHIQTIERDYISYRLAQFFLSRFPYNIELIWSEALFYKPTKTYDFIFIDAAKVQYEKLFNKYHIFLKSHGIIICDNIHFNNLNINLLKISRSTKRIINKINNFKIFLKNNNHFETSFLNIGDGLSISWKKNLKFQL
ncbi:O-methyltransferase [Candidatus Phytoplasma pini]|uniref:O-methyltransferase, family 3 n=1 Tax=Candidatus Phytoplasma pini TaxID=267362 RepID=A0A559KJB0_9MOLU|nr:hypothetical protein [Candidatus Phytoplasma pini]TVY12197.1 O-methyltransferase, family 3 [Candidatus Phytoplasma pini]